MMLDFWYSVCYILIEKTLDIFLIILYKKLFYELFFRFIDYNYQ
jgi:hypothetical protein